MNSIVVQRNGSSTSSSTRASVVNLSRGIGMGIAEHDTLQQRVIYRQKRLAEAYQQNLESVLEHAIADSRNEIASQQLDPDWWHSFQRMAEQIHTPKMQQLWGKILTQELAQPRSFSLKALETLKRMNHHDAQVLLKAASLCCTLELDATPMILCGWRTEATALGLVRSKEMLVPLSQYGLPYSAVLSLRELGLLHAVELETGRLPQRQLNLSFYKQRLRFIPKYKRLHLRYYRFTNCGQELAQLLKQPANQDYLGALTTTTISQINWL